MKLEVGKSYYNRLGEIITIVRKSNDFYIDRYLSNYYEDGTRNIFREMSSDLIKEVVDKKEITTEDINNAAMDWYSNQSIERPSIKTSWNAAIEWYKSQLNQE